MSNVKLVPAGKERWEHKPPDPRYKDLKIQEYTPVQKWIVKVLTLHWCEEYLNRKPDPDPDRVADQLLPSMERLWKAMAPPTTKPDKGELK